ncbi:ZIP family metal transporter [Defluviitalea phaphyphila]|uniref:ZIP family metal transporter n=1 Tax=Defluviitalea phaphyphila TaxID=1473580 RepID=UPI00072FD23B|nr:ZIP family metal transporter [Defluviitalea phaphyphila]
MGIINVFITGYIAGFVGILVGVILSFLTSKKGKRFQGTIMGFTAGLMISIVCFDLLPEAFERGGLYIGIIGMILGIIIMVKLDNKVINYIKKIESSKKIKYLKTGLLMGFVISIHNMPEGIAIGSLITISFYAGIRLAIIIALHCIPEGIAIAIPLREGGIKKRKIILYSFIFAIPMGLGSILGYIISEVSLLFVTLSIGFSGGIMLYVTCGELLPESKEMWRGRLSTIGTMLGIIIGIAIASNI